MNRRQFLSWLGVGTAVVAVAPSALLSGSPACVAPAVGYSTYVMGQDAIIGGYVNYVNFSDFAISAAIDEAVQNTASELSHQAGYSIRELVKTSQVSFS